MTEKPKGGKLVRDNIPLIIATAGGMANTRVLEEDGYREALFAKLFEEAAELVEASETDVVEELADCLEVLKAVANNFGLEWETVEDEATKKKDARGGFEGRIWLEGEVF